ncbi:FecR domain-containing protein [Acidobacteria bacterium AB60]|nr:FecR domain-containing protein [Acidobacteria bacterium AB60]
MKLRIYPATAGVSLLLLAGLLSAQNTATTSASKVRIVRLSEVKGAVLLDRSAGRGLEPAITNLPIVEQNRLETATGVAEVEFEDNSSLRVAPDSAVEFPELSRTAAGTTVSSVHLIKGMAYLTLVKSKGNEFHLLFGEHQVAVPPGTHLRLDVNNNDARLAVLDGAVTIDTPHGPMEVTKKKTATLLLSGDIDPTVAKNVAENEFDTWDKQSTDYHARAATMSAFGNSPYAYGMSDMMYYGAFSDVGGCGSMWRPYFTSASWEPYSAGAWAYYAGSGYSWVSPYPWGWTPYHYGSWNYCPGAGWGWQPGGTWNGLNNGTMIAMNPAGGSGRGTMPVIPPHPPKPGSPSLVPVISKPLVRSEMGSSNSFVFRKDSAGFGVPRGELGQLNKFSAHAATRGSVSTPVYMSMGPGSGVEARGGASAALGAGAMRRGSPPPARSSYDNEPYSAGGGSYSAPAARPGSSSSSSSGSGTRSAPAPTGGGRGPR